MPKENLRPILKPSRSKEVASQEQNETYVVTADEKKPQLAKTEREKESRRLKAKESKRDPFKCPIAVFETEDPNKKCMYPKHLVYSQGKDIQLEEIRASRYWNKVKGQLELNACLEKPKTFRDMGTQTEHDEDDDTILNTKAFKVVATSTPFGGDKNTNKNRRKASRFEPSVQTE